VIYESGTEYSHTTGETYHSGTTTGYSSAGNFVYGMYSGTSTSHNTSKKQTVLASKFEPPHAQSYKNSIIAGVIASSIIYLVIYKDIFNWFVVFYFRPAMLTVILGMTLAFLLYTGIRYSLDKPSSDNKKHYKNPYLLIGAAIFLFLYSFIGYGFSDDSDYFLPMYALVILCSIGYLLKERLSRRFNIPFLKRKEPDDSNIRKGFFSFFTVIIVIYVLTSIIIGGPHGFSYDFQWNVFAIMILLILSNYSIEKYIRSRHYNKHIYPFLYQDWLNTWHCNSCSCVFRKKRNANNPLFKT